MSAGWLKSCYFVDKICWNTPRPQLSPPAPHLASIWRMISKPTWASAAPHRGQRGVRPELGGGRVAGLSVGTTDIWGWSLYRGGRLCAMGCLEASLSSTRRCQQHLTPPPFTTLWWPGVSRRLQMSLGGQLWGCVPDEHIKLQAAWLTLSFRENTEYFFSESAVFCHSVVSNSLRPLGL